MVKPGNRRTDSLNFSVTYRTNICSVYGFKFPDLIFPKKSDQVKIGHWLATAFSNLRWINFLLEFCYYGNINICHQVHCTNFGVISNFRKQVSRTKLEAEKENIKVPTTVEDYCVKSRPSRSEPEDFTDFYDDDYADDVDDDDDDDDCFDYSEDSGNEETWYGNWSRTGTLPRCIFCTFV